jgi:hypothetical protein
MARRDEDEERWEELTEREALGETLTDEEDAFCRAFEERDELAAREADLLDEMAMLDAAPDPRSGALVDAALKQLADEDAELARIDTTPARRAPSARTAMWLGAAGAVAAAAALGLAVTRETPESQAAQEVEQPSSRVELVFASGDVHIGAQDGTKLKLGTKLGTKLTGGSLLEEGSRIEVGDGAACFAMDPGIDVCLGAQSQVRLTQVTKASRRLDLLAGEVGVQLQPQPEGSRLSVVADGVWSTAVGTAFTVTRDPVEGVHTTVLHGKVRVGKSGDGEQLVVAHQQARMRARETEVTALTRSDEASRWALLQPTSLWSDPVAATLEVRGSGDATAEALLDGEVIGIAPLSTLVPIGRHRLVVRIDGRVALERELVAVAGERIDVQVPAPPHPDTTEPDATEPDTTSTAGRSTRTVSETPTALTPNKPASSPAAMLAQARRLIRKGRYAEAARQYDSIRKTFPHSPEAKTVLVPLAQLELERIGRPERALTHAERYLQSGGVLAQEARIARIRALRALGQASQEAKAIEEFLRRHPDSLRTRRLEQRLESLQK